MTHPVGRAIPRVDGVAKVTGAARYAADRTMPRMLHGALVLSTVARGVITAMDLSAAAAAPGVVAVYNHTNSPRLVPGFGGPAPMQDATITTNGQIIGYVVAETLEQAQDAATLVTTTYGAVQTPSTFIVDAPAGTAQVPDDQDLVVGDPQAGLAKADVTVTGRYTTPPHHHNAIEPHAIVAYWDDDRLTAHLSTQGVGASQRTLSSAVRIPAADAQVRSEYVGGGFGGKTSAAAGPYAQYTVAISRALRRPVKLVVPRAQLYSIIGQRAEYQADVTLGATRDGTLTSLIHIGTQQQARGARMLFNPNRSVQRLYRVPNLHTRAQAVPLDLPTAQFMRAPELPAHFALETALDELSYELGMDPVDLRIHNYTDISPDTGLRFSSKYLREAYALGRHAFGWDRRNPRIGAMRDGTDYIGWGMATEMHAHDGGSASARVRVGTDGNAVAECGTQDIGTGTYTVMTQVASEALGIPLHRVEFRLGDTTYPAAQTSASSATVPSVTGAVDKAARAVRDSVVRLAVSDPASPLHGLAPDQVGTEHGDLFSLTDRSRQDNYRDVVARHGAPVENTATSTNEPGNSCGAVFVEVRVDPRYGRVRVSRVVGAYDCGRVLNQQTARSQVIGGMTWGIGIALMEHTLYDRRTARVTNPNLSTYLIAVNADVPDLEVLFVDRPDPASTALGARGFGECPITGVPSAIGNAIYHATGRRIRDLPITQDKLL
ncbi:xanthine dehydrogenase family protein molybdopterin-binding subunit [Pseudonocardia spinosispora]|uniref:xanthine dehydrogenase family protein molybdopterin-binding subunit n=1 Tax=Pseudonocardia spinosispora TaxID=103441 RepID=UPI0004293875|nr:xanthine dehydrogenase family protein molybdopterin-binding subunit [Pseudonocardia spinosispora]